MSSAILPLFGLAKDSEFGGAEVQVYSLARYLQRRFQVDVVTSASLGTEPKVVDGIRLIPAVDDEATSNPLSKVGLLRSLRRSRADVYVGTCAAPQVALIALHARLSRSRFVYRVAHQIDCDGTFEREHGWRGRLFGMGLRSADVVVAQHDDQLQLLAGRGIPAQVIRSSFDFGRIGSSTGRDVDCLWVGRCDEWKRPELFLDLAEALPGRKFVMICPPVQGRETLFEAIRSRTGQIGNLTFFERVPFEQVQSWFERAKLLVGTSTAEGFPNTYIQACAAGTPIVSLEVDPERFIDANEVGVVADGDATRLAVIVGGLLDDSEKWRKLSGNALTYARNNHDLETQGAKWAELLRALGRRSRQGDLSVGERELS